MTDTSDIDVRDLKSVRAAQQASEKADVVLGDDFLAPDSTVDREVRQDRENRRRVNMRGSPLARKIVMFNLIGLMILVIGVFYFNSSSNSLSYQRADALTSEVRLVANVLESQVPVTGDVDLRNGLDTNLAFMLARLDLRPKTEVLVFDLSGKLVTSTVGKGADAAPPVEGLAENASDTILTDTFERVWNYAQGLLGDTTPQAPVPIEERIAKLVTSALEGSTQVRRDPANGIYAAATPILRGIQPVGVVAMTTAKGELSTLARQEREKILKVFVIAILVSIGLSLVLASAIANPISDLAAAAEMGRARNARKTTPGRIRIPDLTGRPDEIGRLSGALRGMVAALYDRIDGNEQFAADVAHEIKNPLASLRSAVGTMRIAKKDDQREKLLDLIEHDVRRLDRLVSDISNASRLDAELVKEEEESFNVIKTLGNLTEYLGQQAKDQGIDFISDLPDYSVMVDGLEARLAQVFVNLITNATSFCGEGDAVRVWARTREDRILIVVEDTGPGIPDNALTKVFQRFYSERPEGQFGDNSGLGLAISKQIVEAHGGVIWAENIRPPEAAKGDPPLGARFVVGLPS